MSVLSLLGRQWFGICCLVQSDNQWCFHAFVLKEFNGPCAGLWLNIINGEKKRPFLLCDAFFFLATVHSWVTCGDNESHVTCNMQIHLISIASVLKANTLCPLPSLPAVCFLLHEHWNPLTARKTRLMFVVFECVLCRHAFTLVLQSCYQLCFVFARGDLLPCFCGLELQSSHHYTLFCSVGSGAGGWDDSKTIINSYI